MNEKALTQATQYIVDWLRFKYEREDIPGFVVAIAHKGEVIFNEAYGYANLETKEKMTPHHIFRIASHSKTFTATAIMQLQEQGKLQIDDYVIDSLPWLNEHKDRRWAKVTIRQLLSHGAGVIRDGMQSDYWQLHYSFPDEAKLKKDILEAELVLDADVKMKYSNYGYSLLGMVVEIASGQSYNEYVTKNIVYALELKNTGPELVTSIKDKLVTGHTRPDFDKKRLPITKDINTHAMSSATGFYSCTEDLCKYFSAHIIGSGKLLTDASKKEMQAAAWKVENVKDKEEYGLGLEIEHVGKRRLFGHGGGFPGNITNSLVDAERDLVVIVLTNANGTAVGKISKAVIKVLDYFERNYKDHGKPNKFRGRFMNLWSPVDIISMSVNKLVAPSPFDWELFDNVEELKKVDNNTFKITKTDSFSSPGELVKFNFGKNGVIESVNYAGSTMLPEKEYIKQMSKKGRIG